VSYSPILTILTETLKGVDVISASRKQNDFIMKMYNKLDDHYAVHIYIEGANKWYKVILVSIANVFYSIVLMYLIVNKHIIPVTAISLILNYTSTLNEQLVNTMSHYSNVETAMIALERCDTYINIPQERKCITTTTTPHASSWPSKGKIVFTNYSTRYRHNLPLILRNVNITIHPNERIGIIGRTGSGKSTFVLALCRILESVEGGIYIDDVDISGVDLQLLRKSVTIVTQDPFVIEGSLRENVDPLGEYGDDEVVEVLNAFKLFNDVKDMKERLSVAVGESGMNLSVGQRQLICFARAALKKSKVVVLDEATASIDVDTERIMKSNIDIYFKNSTVIIIAHHMEMVKGCNRVFIIDNGIIKEKDDVI
jgi:ABC-type multidrug transport system fused ATPase/permease subunit